MPASQGDKDQSFLTAKEKWLIGIFIATAVIASITFVANFVLILQLKDSIHTSETDDLLKHLQNRTANLENKMHHNQFQNQKETEYLRQGFENRVTQLETKLGEVTVKSNRRYDTLLATQRWIKLSNGLHYKVVEWDDDIDFASAEEDCKAMGARLASTGIRNATIRREISNRLTGMNNWMTWIGLNQPYDNTSWFWSDEKDYEDVDMSWASNWDFCSTGKNRHGVIAWETSTGTLYCYSSSSNVQRCICEI